MKSLLGDIIPAITGRRRRDRRTQPEPSPSPPAPQTRETVARADEELAGQHRRPAAADPG